MSAQPVPDAALTAALGGYYGHPTAITAADPDIVDGLTAGLAAGMASFDQRLRDVQDEYARAGASWDTTRDRLNAQLAAQAEAMAELDDKATQAYEDRDEAAHRAEQAEALADEHAANARELGERLRQAEAERDQLRAADGRVRALAVRWHHGLATDEVHARELDAALDQAPAAESPYATGGEILPRTQGDQIPAQLSGCDFAINPEPAAEQDEGGQ